jgi:hypothetical protein
MSYRLAGTLREAILNPLNAAKSHDEAATLRSSSDRGGAP